METLQSLNRRIKGVEDLGSVVRTMKSLAAVSIRQYEEAAQSLEQYEATVRAGLGFVLRDWPFPPTRKSDEAQPVAILIGSDQGMCGRLNEDVFEHGFAEVSQMNDNVGRRYFIALGERMEGQMLDVDDIPVAALRLPGSVEGMTETAAAMLHEVQRLQSMHEVTTVQVYHAQQRPSGAIEPRGAQIWPIEEAVLAGLAFTERAGRASRSLPFYTMSREALFSDLVGYFLFGALVRALAASLAAENAARLQAMQGAEKNIEEKLGELRAHARKRRQMTITEELLDIVAGYQALGVGREAPEEPESSESLE